MDCKGDSPIICYTRSNFYVNRGEVTTPTIIEDVFPLHDGTITFIKLMLNFLSCLAYLIAHLPYVPKKIGLENFFDTLGMGTSGYLVSQTLLVSSH